MASVLQSVNVNVDTGGLDSQLGTQVAQLAGIARTIAGLVDNPPQSVSDFVTGISELPLPEFSVSGDLSGAFDAALGALPDDLETLVGPAVEGLLEIETLIGEQLVPILGDAIQAAQAIQRLVSVDLSCGAAGGTSGAPSSPTTNGEGGGEGDAGGEAEAAEQRRLEAASAQIAEVNTRLDGLPSPFTAAAAIEILAKLLTIKGRDAFLRMNLPLIDDIANPLQTLQTWSGMTPAEVGLHMEASLTMLSRRIREAVPGHLAARIAELSPLEAQLPAVELGAFADGLVSGLSGLEAAIQAGDLSPVPGILSTLNGALDDYDLLRAPLAGGVLGEIPLRCRPLETLADDLFANMSHLLSLVEPTNLPGVLLDGVEAPDPATDQTVEAVRNEIEPVLVWLEALVDQLDFSAIETEVGDVANQANALVSGLSESLTDVAVDVRAAFQGVGDAIDGIGVEELRDSLIQQVDAVGLSLEGALTSGFAPMRDGISEVVQGLSGAVDEFDPAAIVAALESVVQAIADVLGGGEIQAAIQEVSSAVDSVTQTLEQLSFAPVTDEVVALIEQMTAGLRAVQETELNDAVKTALSAALAVLPEDLRPVTDPIIDDFGALVEQGPVPVLEKVRDQPKKLLDHVRAFEPARLVGDQLSAPYQELLGKADGFRPSALLAPLESEFEAVKDRLRRQVNPGQALAALDGPFEGLLAGLDRLSPDQILVPLETAVTDSVNRIIDASPVDEIFAEVNRVFDTVQDALTIAGNLVEVLQKVDGIVNGLAGSAQQIDAWRDGILGKVENVTNAGDLAVAAQDLAQAVDATRHADLLAQLDGGLQSLRDTLRDLDPGGRLSRMINAYNRLAPAVNGLPDSPEKAGLQALLGRFDPFDPAFSAPFRVTNDLAQCIEAARQALAAAESQWTGAFHDPEGALAQFKGISVNGAGLRQIVADSLEPPLRPIRLLLATLETLSVPVGATLTRVTALFDNLTSRVAGLLVGPSSLLAISQAVQGVVDELRNIDLGFLRESLNEVLGEVREEVSALNPAQLAAPVNEAFDRVLDALSLDQILPAGEIRQLDQDYEAVLRKLRDLDPGKLVIDVVQPQFDAILIPLVEAFDLTPAFEALIDFLRGLDEELKQEMERVNTAYQALRGARPEFSISVNIGF